jgi:hypothetical protein
MQWLAAALLVGIVAAAIWFGAREAIVLPLLLWALLHYEALELTGLLDRQKQAWLAFACAAWQGIAEGQLRARDFGWHAHLRPLHEDVSARILLPWLVLLACGALFVLLRTRGGGFRRTFTLAGEKRAKLFRFAGMRISGRLPRALLGGVARVLFLRSLLVSEKEEWVPAGPSLLTHQARHWKTASTAIGFRPDGANIPDAAATPTEWIHRRILPRAGESDPIPRETFVALCRDALREQLGAPWRGLASAPPHVQALAALAFANRFRGERAAQSLAERLAEAHARTTPGEARRRAFSFLAAAALLSERDAVRRVDGWAARHAWTNTAMIAVVGRCDPFAEWGGGRAGVLPSASFLWLKAEDRHLWYALNNIGRRAFHIEGAGAVCHFFNERLADRALVEPDFAKAIGTEVEGRLHGILGYLRDHGMLAPDGAVRQRALRDLIEEPEE